MGSSVCYSYSATDKKKHQKGGNVRQQQKQKKSQHFYSRHIEILLERHESVEKVESICQVEKMAAAT